MQTYFAILLFVSVVPIGVHLVRARRERRAVHVFDDVVAHLALPSMILVLMSILPPVVERVLMALMGIIAIAAIWRLVYLYRSDVPSRATR